MKCRARFALHFQACILLPCWLHGPRQLPLALWYKVMGRICFCYTEVLMRCLRQSMQHDA